MVWISAIVFTAIGVYLFIRRRESAEAQSIAMGATVRPGCIVIEAVLFLLVAAAFIILHYMGWLG
jgi:hypothetical protein